MPNDFSGDPHCISLYRFENGALITDSKGANTLTNVNTVVADTVNFKEGAASADLEVNNTKWFYRADADLSADFPLKSGTANKTFSFCCWFKTESFSGDNSGRTLFAKFDEALTKFSVLVAVANRVTPNEENIQFVIGHTGGTGYEEVFHDTDLSLATWYHLTISYDDADKSYAIRLRDTSGNIVGSDLTGNFANNISIVDVNFTIGTYLNNSAAKQCHDGLIDEFVPFDDIITADEATAIAKGLYPLDRQGQISWSELEIPNAVRRVRVSWSEFEIPNAGRRAIISWGELELPDAARRGIISWGELEIPEIFADRRGQISWNELEIPLGNRRAFISWNELQIPVTERRCLISWIEMALDAPVEIMQHLIQRGMNMRMITLRFDFGSSETSREIIFPSSTDMPQGIVASTKIKPPTFAGEPTLKLEVYDSELDKIYSKAGISVGVITILNASSDIFPVVRGGKAKLISTGPPGSPMTCYVTFFVLE